jgi:CheY-like chemotaxis protein
VKIYSEVGEGTTIKLYLPGSREAEDIEVAVDPGVIEGGSETVLVVEDDDEVRATVVEILGDLGYRVLKAVDAQSALNVIESGIPIDMLFTDVVMPGTLKSPELARKAKERLPELAVLFTSGYTENSIVHGGRLDAGVELLSKPYTREALARKFRHVLANQRQRSAGLAARRLTRAPAPLRTQPGAGGQVTVLLVEDDAVIRATTAELLQASGYVVVDAASAEDAATALQTVPIDVLVTDVNLPGASGPEFARRARDLRPGVGIVFATGETSAVPPGTDAVLLAKPYGTEALQAAIAAALPQASARVDDPKTLERES